MTPRVAVVGAGLSGAACATVLRAAGIEVDVLERERVVGGRMAAPELHGRHVDIGAAYFTAKDADFAALVDGWRALGLARPWTDTFEVFGAGGRSSTSGPVRWATRDGLCSLVRDLLPDVTRGHAICELAELTHDAVVLAMPDPQAARLAGAVTEWIDYQPVIAVAAGWERRAWSLDAVAFVNDDPDIALIADDGARRGDGAPVLVIHTTGERAAAHLDEPGAAVGPALAALGRVLGVTAPPAWTHAHRWTYAKPAGTHGGAPWEIVGRERPIGLCGDSWCPDGVPRIESAWLSGRRLGIELVDRLG